MTFSTISLDRASSQMVISWNQPTTYPNNTFIFPYLEEIKTTFLVYEPSGFLFKDYSPECLVHFNNKPLVETILADNKINTSAFTFKLINPIEIEFEGHSGGIIKTIAYQLIKYK